MCNCRREITGKIEEHATGRFGLISPKANIKGYAISFGGDINNNPKEVGYLEVEIKGMVTSKKGVTREKTVKTSMQFTYCPFCGEKY